MNTSSVLLRNCGLLWWAALSRAAAPSVRFGSPERLDVSAASAGGGHLWFPNNGAVVGDHPAHRRLVLPIRLSCDTPCYNASMGAQDLVVWRASDAAFPRPLPPATRPGRERLLPAANTARLPRTSDAGASLPAEQTASAAGAEWSIAERVPSLNGHTVPWFTSSFLGSGADAGALTTVQPHRAAPSGPAATRFPGHATRWTVVENGTRISKATVAQTVTYSVPGWANISSLDGCGQIGQLQRGAPLLIQSVNYNTVGSTGMGVAAFVSVDGLQWRWLSVAAVPADLPSPATGASETALSVLTDGSVLIVIRTGNGFHGREALYGTRSGATSPGEVWSKPAALGSAAAAPWGVKPTLLQVPRGPLLLATGRPGLFLWVSYDGGDVWSAHNVAAAHNAALSLSDPGRFTAKCVAAAVQGPAEAETTAYTSLVHAVNGADAVVCYDRLAHGWFGPSRNQSDRVYCLPVWLA